MIKLIQAWIWDSFKFLDLHKYIALICLFFTLISGPGFSKSVFVVNCLEQKIQTFIILWKSVLKL